MRQLLPVLVFLACVAGALADSQVVEIDVAGSQSLRVFHIEISPDVNTNVIVLKFVQTLDIGAFQRELEELDKATQRQCYMRANSVLASAFPVSLHGRDRVIAASRVLADRLAGS